MKLTVKTAAHPAQKTFFKSLVIALWATGVTTAAVAAKAGVGTPSMREVKIVAKAGIAICCLLSPLIAIDMLSITCPKVLSTDLLMVDLVCGVPETK